MGKWMARAALLSIVVVLGLCASHAQAQWAIGEGSFREDEGGALGDNGDTGGELVPTMANATIHLDDGAGVRTSCVDTAACAWDNLGTAGADGDCWTTNCGSCTGLLWNDLTPDDAFKNSNDSQDVCQSEGITTMTLPAVYCVRLQRDAFNANRWYFMTGSLDDDGLKSDASHVISHVVNGTAVVTDSAALSNSVPTNICVRVQSNNHALWKNGSEIDTDAVTTAQAFTGGIKVGGTGTSSCRSEFFAVAVWENTSDIATAAAAFEAEY